MSPHVPDNIDETTSLERRVLAHERVLQALIAHMAELDPQILVRLTTRFSDPMGIARSEHPFTNTDAYADAFVKAILNVGIPMQRHAGHSGGDRERMNEKSEFEPARQDSHSVIGQSDSCAVSLRNRSGVWEVRIGDNFHGDYTRKDLAMAALQQAVRLLKEDAHYPANTDGHEQTK